MNENILDQYLIKKKIGKGSFSTVYYGIHKHTQKEIALKKIEFGKLQNYVKNKVISEINILQQMNHKNIIKLYDYKCEGEYIYLIMEYCDEDLDQWMDQDHTLNEKIDIITQITNGFVYLHDKNVVHRDIKPANILLKDNIIKICDFGSAKVLD